VVLARRGAIVAVEGLNGAANDALVEMEGQAVRDMIALPGCVPEKLILLRELAAVGDFEDLWPALVDSPLSAATAPQAGQPPR
jgi:hypothetical protein